jgi:DNA-3-methyladenine glycosylase
MGLSRAHNGLDLTGSSELWLEPGGHLEGIVETTRVGVDYAGEWALKPWRFYLEGNPWVSRPVKRAGDRRTGSGEKGAQPDRLK